MTPNDTALMSYQRMGAGGADDEDIDTLSFCDIPLYTDASADSSSSERAAGDLFELFRFPAANSSYRPAESFVFCGRLIPGRDDPPSRKKHRKVVKGYSRWYKVMFGSMRLPGEMGIADIKSRQRQRRHPIPKLPGSSSSSGLIGLVRSLSCKGYCSTAVC